MIVVLIIVVAVAFITGYLIVGFIINKVKLKQHPDTFGEGQASQSQQGTPESEDTTDGRTHSDESRQYGGTWESQREEQKYGRILELKGKITGVDVRKSYCTLLAKYHPDKVDHLGDEFRRIAEVKTREIIEAYEYFRKKYDIR